MPWRLARRPLRRRVSTLVAALALAGAACTAAAQSIAYTVQVVALSDRDAALSVQGDLLREGYPAYVVRSTSAQGDVFRVRVGAFANRPAALYYAEAMPEVSGGRPVPALAEAIPAGITPLAPRLLLQEDVSGVEARLLAFPGGALALRLQWRVPLSQAEYVVVRGGTVERVKAWQLAEGPDGELLRVREMPLWPDTWQQDGPEVRQAFAANLVALIADGLGVGVAEVDAARHTLGSDEVPYLTVVELVVPGSAEAPRLLGVGLPASGVSAAGPIAYLGVDPSQLPGVPESARLDLATGSVVGELAVVPWPDLDRESPPSGGVGEAAGAAAGDGSAGAPVTGEPPEAPATESADAGSEDDEPADDEAARASPATEGPTATPPAGGEPSGSAPEPTPGPAAGAGEVVGDGWVASADGRFVRLRTVDAETGTAASWRAGVGTPLWSDGSHLLALLDGVLLVYDFLPRQ